MDNKVYRLLYVQLNNDFSGSTYALKAIIKSHKIKNQVLMTSLSRPGFLSDIKVNHVINVPYSFRGKGLLTVLELLKNWINGSYAFIRVHRKSPFDIVYLNTIHPWHIALIAKILGLKVIYHVHEFYANPNLLMRFYLWMMRNTANTLVYVSEDCFRRYRFLEAHNLGIDELIQYTPIRYNTLKKNSLIPSDKIKGPIIMICSPKKYKGVENFICLSRKIPSRKFKLYLSSPYNFDFDIPENVDIYIGKTDLQTQLFEASLLLNLSQSPDWIETFGLTIWESLSQGTPVVVPDIGGPLEIVNNKCGRIVDVKKIDVVEEAIEDMLFGLSNYEDLCYGSIKQSEILFNKYPIHIPV
ncbi:glycosyltransferase [Schleiferiaceae bacterium]|nr:glycosyltransferase [Schleiferiaceae bacterium]